MSQEKDQNNSTKYKQFLTNKQNQVQFTLYIAHNLINMNKQ